MTTTNETMTWDGFREQAAARAGLHAIGGDLTARLAYLALGLCGEAGEYARAQAVGDGDAACLSELGDVAARNSRRSATPCARCSPPRPAGSCRGVTSARTRRRSTPRRRRGSSIAATRTSGGDEWETLPHAAALRAAMGGAK